MFNVFVVLFVSCYICLSYLPLTLMGYNGAMNKILFYSNSIRAYGPARIPAYINTGKHPSLDGIWQLPISNIPIAQRTLIQMEASIV